MHGLLALDLWDIVIEVLRKTKDKIQPKIHKLPRNWGSLFDSNTKTQQVTRKQMDDQLSEVDHVPTNPRSSQGECVENSQSRS